MQLRSIRMNTILNHKCMDFQYSMFLSFEKGVFHLKNPFFFSLHTGEDMLHFNHLKCGRSFFIEYIVSISCIPGFPYYVTAGLMC